MFIVRSRLDRRTEDPQVLGLILAAAVIAGAPPASPRNPQSGESQLWLMNFGPDWKSRLCVPTTLDLAIGANLREQAKKNPTTEYNFKWINYYDWPILRVTIKPKRKTRSAFIFATTKEHCEISYAAWAKDPLWNYTNRYVVRITPKGSILPKFD